MLMIDADWYVTHDSDENRDRIMEAGADGYMAKPVENDTLLRHVDGLLNHRQTSEKAQRDKP